MHRVRVMATCGDASGTQIVGQGIWIGGANDVEVPDGIAAGGHVGQRQIADAGERLRQRASCGAPFLVPAVEQPQLQLEHDRLDRVEPSRVALEIMVILPPLPVFAERANRLGEARVARGERAGVAHRSEVLGRIEAERGRKPGGTGAEAVALGPVRLAGILDDREACPLGK